MPDFVLLTCPSCGSELKITDEIDRFACNYCGNELVVKRGGGITSLKLVIDSIKDVKKGVDKTASELAIKRLEAEIKDLEDQILKLVRPRDGDTNHRLSSEYEYFSKKFKTKVHEKIIGELEKSLENQKTAYKKHGSSILGKAGKLVFNFDKGRSWESRLIEFENDLYTLKKHVSLLRDKQSQINKHRNIVNI